jgi:predicted nucleic acid-binding protein
MVADLDAPNPCLIELSPNFAQITNSPDDDRNLEVAIETQNNFLVS